MTRSRLSGPTAKSPTGTLRPACAAAAPRAAVDGVLPAPPLPEVTTRTCAAISSTPYAGLIERRHHDGVVLEPGLDRPAVQAFAHVVGGAVPAVDRQQLGFALAAEDAGARVAGGARNGAAAQRAVDVDRAAGHHLGAGGDRAHHGPIAVGKHHRPPGTPRA